MPTVNAIVAPASAVPEMMPPASELLITSSVATALITGAVGATVSMLIARVPAVLVLPAASLAVALRVSAPWPMAVMSAATKV